MEYSYISKNLVLPMVIIFLWLKINHNPHPTKFSAKQGMSIQVNMKYKSGNSSQILRLVSVHTREHW